MEALLNLKKSIFIFLTEKPWVILQNSPYTCSIILITFSCFIRCIVMMHSKKYPSVIMQTIFCIKIYTIQKMIKKANEHGFFILKIVNSKFLTTWFLFTKAPISKTFCWSFYCFQDIGNKTQARKNKFNTKYSYFFCPAK